MAGLALSTLLSSLGTSIANVALPALSQAFDAPFQDVQWIVLAYLVSMTMVMVSAGRLGDRTGRRRLLLAGMLLFTAASVACALAPTLGLLIAARAGQGVGAAVMMALTMALAGELMPKARTGSAMGLLGTMSAIGTALGPSLGGVLIAVAGWRAIFLATVPLGIITFLIAHRHLPIDQAARAHGAGPDGAATPVLTLLHDRALAASLATNALVSAVMMATLVVGPFYLSTTLGQGAAAVGFAMSVGPLATALTSVLAGRLVDRLGASRMTLAGLATLAAGAFILALLPAWLGVPGYIGPLVVMTMGYAVFQAANNTAVMTGIRPGERGVISGLLNLSRNLGLVCGAAALGAVFAAGGMRVTFAVAGGLVVAALWIAECGRRGSVRLTTFATATRVKKPAATLTPIAPDPHPARNHPT